MSLLEVTNERIEQFLSKNKRKLAYMESYFSIDDNRDKKEDFTEDKLKVLCVFLTPASSRAVSNTFNALMTCCKKADMENVVVDSCYYPEDANMELLEKEGIPYIFGSTCHQPASFYDLILMSNAVCPEVLNIPKFLHHSGLGLTIEERDKQDVPLIIMGGAAANETSIVLGPINRDGKCIGKSMVDMANYGYGEQMMTEIAGAFLRFKKEGINLHSRKEVRERLIDEKVAHDYLFFPEYYEWVYDEDKFTIKEIKKLDDRLPDRVNYNRIHSEDFGWDYKTFNLSGDNADSHDLQISTGCSGSSSCCAFCMESTVAGHYTEKRLETVIEQMKEVRRHCAPNTLSYFSFNLNYYYRFMDLLAESSKYFSGVTLLNERVDIIANSPEQMQLAKKLGLKRVSMAIEGMGERVRDGILNKNLPHETLMQGIRVVSKLGVMMVKFG